MSETFETYLERANSSPAEVLAYYRLLRKAKQLRSALVFEARCAQAGCLLLHVFQTPAGVAFYVPRYKLSPAANAAESTEDGRRANTEDGQNHWREHAGLTEFALNFPLNCDHYRGLLEGVEISGRPGDPTRRTF